MSDEKILTLHPDPAKKGRNIDLSKYHPLRDYILAALSEGEVSFQELMGGASVALPDFEGNVGWYLETVKLDLLARGEIEVVDKKKPQHLQLAG